MADQHNDFVPTPEQFEQWYSESEKLWSGNPNATLVEYAAALTPGTALDIGCGEGADLAWLTENGWDAVGIDFAPTAVARTRARGLNAEVREFLDTTGRFDLVTVHYGGILADSASVAHLESLVGGTLIFVHHDLESATVAMPEWLQGQLQELEVVEYVRRGRHVTEGAGAHHTHDCILIARRP